MKTRNLASCLAVTSACLAMANPAAAADNCSGYSIGIPDVPAVRVLIHEDSTLPMHLASGECASTSQTSSQCTYTDEDGDQWTDVNEWRSGSFDGTWRNVSGTGKYTKAAGSNGWWKRVRKDPVRVWAFGGYCAMADKAK